ncbi:MAG: ABC transporter ATP-binding protein [Bauldia sp.]|nr:ABC transporter ATP-binding protein [Bauldia sp.]
MTAGSTEPAGGTASNEMLRVENLTKHFPLRSGVLGRRTGSIRAVDGVSFSLGRGETLAIVGESGSGKSTIARLIIGLHRPTSGRVLFRSEDITGYDDARMRRIWRDMQFVFQDPHASLDPRMRAGQIVAEALAIRREGTVAWRAEEAVRLLALVGLPAEHATRYPHEFSGGQRQRLGIARALAVRPKLLLLDEPVSALDVSMQAQLINLLHDLQAELNLSYVFIAHDLAVVRHIAHRVAVMYLGRIVEIGPRQEIFEQPSHPYTQALLSAVPIPDPEGREKRSRIVLRGEPPSPSDPPSGCPFRTRCFKVAPICSTEPPLRDVGGGVMSACHLAGPAAANSAGAAEAKGTVDA